jgi:AcrR family transcriptional regulator
LVLDWAEMIKNMSNEGKIIAAAYRLFLQKGYRQTTMDEIALDLGMSKKTLYRYFPGKMELLFASFELLKTKITAQVEAILANKYISFPHKLKSILTAMATHLAPINSDLLNDLRQFAPEIWEDLNTYIHESAYLRFHDLLEQGRAQGFVNPKINGNLAVMLYAAAVQSLLDPKFRSQFPESIQSGMRLSPAEVYDQAITILYMGVLTEEGRDEFAKG